MSIGRRIAVTWLVFSAGAALACLVAPVVGSTSINLWRVFDSSIPFADNADAQIFFVARLPRVLAGAMVGSALAASGVVLQALLRNPLATPFTLGVSAGAALGAMLALTFDLPSGIAGFSAVPIASFAGSLGAIAIVYGLARARHRGLSTNVLLLAGVTLNSFFSALILFVQFLSDFSQTFRTVRWLMGDLDVSSYAPLAAAVPPLALSFGAFAVLPRKMNLLSISDESAASRGVDVHRTQRLAFLSASLATGAAVSLGGPVGFIGIVVPHLVRLIVGADHRLVLPAAAFGGAAFLVACDTVSRTVLAPLEVPVGVVTAIIGGPFFSMAAHQKPLTALALLSMLVVSAATSAQTRPQRIVSIIPSTTEMLFAMGAGLRVVGVGNFDRYPPEVLTRTKVGGLIDPDVERIISLKPDLVVVYATQNDLRTQMRRANIPVFLYQHSGLPDITSTIRELGARVGNAREAAELANRIEADIAEVRKRVAGRPRPRTLLVFGRDAATLRGIYASGGGGFLHDVLEVAGGVNVFADVKRQSIQTTSELAVARAPDVIVEIGADTASSSGRNLRAWDALPSIPAVRNRRIYLLTGDGMMNPGPRIVGVRPPRRGSPPP